MSHRVGIAGIWIPVNVVEALPKLLFLNYLIIITKNLHLLGGQKYRIIIGVENGKLGRRWKMNRYQRNKAITRRLIEGMQKRREFIAERAMQRLNRDHMDRMFKMLTSPEHVADVVAMKMAEIEAAREDPPEFLWSGWFR